MITDYILQTSAPDHSDRSKPLYAVVMARGARDDKSAMVYPYPEVITVETDCNTLSGAKENALNHFPNFFPIDSFQY